MSQISPPMRILLIGAIVFIAAWFAFLRPGGSDTATTPAATDTATTAPATDGSAPAASAPGQTVQAAQSAADAASANAVASAGGANGTAVDSTDAPAAGTTAGATTTAVDAATTAAIKEATSVGLPADVAKALVKHKVTVLFFWDPKAADDTLVRKALKDVDRHDGKVAVHVANVRTIARYAPITRGVNVEQSPTVVVLDRDRKGTVLEGYVDTLTIDQAVTDALGDAAFTPKGAYFKQVNAVCRQAATKANALDTPAAPAELAPWLARLTAISSASDAQFAAIKAPKGDRAFAKRFAKTNAKGTTLLKQTTVKAASVKDPAALSTLLTGLQSRSEAIAASNRPMLEANGLGACL